MSGASRLVSPVLAGRDAELHRLDQSLAEAVAGGSQRTVLLGAEAGGGKSRLILEFTARVRDRAEILGGRCVPELEAGLPYAPFTAALRDLVRVRGTAAVAALATDGATADLARILPEFGPAAGGLEPEVARARLFEVARAILEALARNRPTVLVIEDAHWADGATRDLLSFLAGNLPRSPLLLIVSYRTEELHRAHPLRPLLAELSRLDSVVELGLARLDRRDVATQLAGILGRPASAETLDAVYRRGEGVPLFTEVLLDRQGDVRPDLPGSLRDLILGVTRELPVETQSLLRAMAVGGVRVNHDLLGRVTKTDDPVLSSHLRLAVESNVLVSDADGYAFRHALIRESVRDGLLPGEAAQIHRAYAEALEAAPSLAPDAWLSLALARHWRVARDGDRALRAAWDAAREAAARLAYPEQLEMLELVLELWPLVPGAGGHTGCDRTSVIELAADAACWAAEPERGLAHVEAAIAALEPELDAPRIAGMLLQRAVMRQQLLRPGELEDLRAALRLCREPTRRRAETLGQLARALVRHGHPGEAKPLAAELRSLATELRDDEYGLEGAIVAARVGRPDSGAAAALRAAIDTARRCGSGRLEIIAFAALQEVLERGGEHARAAEAGREAVVRTRLAGQARYIGATVAHHLAQSLMSAGLWDEALETLDGAMAVNPAPAGRAELLNVRASIAIARGEADAARMLDELRVLDPDAEANPAMLLLEIEHRLAGGDPAGAEAVAAGLPARFPDADPHILWPLLCAALRAHADSGRDPDLRTGIEAIAERLPITGAVAAAHATTLAAERARAAGQADPAAWDGAAEAWKALGQIGREAYASMRAAFALATLGDRAGATARLRHAGALATRLGAVPLLSQLDALARRVGLEPFQADAPAPESSPPLGLTPREVAVLRLVAAGRSNREIAAELFISPKTASVHVSNILGKLGVATRSAAAATAHRLRLFEPA